MRDFLLTLNSLAIKNFITDSNEIKNIGIIQSIKKRMNGDILCLIGTEKG